MTSCPFSPKIKEKFDRGERIREKIRYWINKVCDGIELLIAIAAVLALLYTGAAYAITKLGIYPSIPVLTASCFS